MSHINWPALNALTDTGLRAAILASMDNKPVHEWFVRAFPDLFQRKRTPIPLSYLLAKFEEYRVSELKASKKSAQRELAYGIDSAWARDKWLVPPIFMQYDSQIRVRSSSVFRFIIAEALVGVEVRWPMIISVYGKKCVVVAISFHNEPRLGTHLKRRTHLGDNLEFVQLVETKYIDFNS